MFTPPLSRRNGEIPPTFPFPGVHERPRPRRPDITESVLEGLSDVSRRIDDLARELNCLGFFDDDEPDRPRAA